jgi:hypothetical protein
MLSSLSPKHIGFFEPFARMITSHGDYGSGAALDFSLIVQDKTAETD